MPAIAVVKDCASFVGASELQRRIPDFLCAALGALFLGRCHCIDVVLFHRLNRGVQFLAKQRGEICRFGHGRRFIRTDI